MPQINHENEPDFTTFNEQHVRAFIDWHGNRADYHQRLKEAGIAELAMRGLIQTESVGE